MQLLLVMAALLVGCAPTLPDAASPTITQAAAQMFPTALASVGPGTTDLPVSSTPLPITPTAPLPAVTATPTPAFALCSPLEGLTLEELGQPDLLKNPFQEPRPGMDDGHHGADFAYWSRGERMEMLGLPVMSVLNGRVAGVIRDRPPYGNAVLIETRLEQMPSAWLAALQLPEPAPTVPPAPNLFCPAAREGAFSNEGRSLYLLYAHLNHTPTLAVNESVTCGQVIGEVGTTGKSVNPHLHLETRIGPSAATFLEMAHYDNAATEEEMRTYCTWRVSGLFQMFDPMRILALQP